MCTWCRPSSLERWVGSPCLRYRCAGRFAPITPRGTGYYRRLYRQGATRRVVTGEHTGLLGRREREDLEQAFKEGTAARRPQRAHRHPHPGDGYRHR